MSACYHCGTALPPLLPGSHVGRRDTCSGCHRDLHACVQCANWDPSARVCQEPSAETVRDREAANFCDWFRPGARATARGGTLGPGGAGADDASRRARAAAEALFKPKA